MRCRDGRPVTGFQQVAEVDAVTPLIVRALMTG